MPASVQKVVWDWKSGSQGNAAETTFRRPAVIQVAVMVAIGFVLDRWLGHLTVARIVWGLAAVFLILGLALPRVYRHVHLFGKWLGLAVGQLLTWVLLIPLYWLVFFPVAVVLRIRGRDPMNRRLLGQEYTCWIRPNRSLPRKATAGNSWSRMRMPAVN